MKTILHQFHKEDFYVPKWTIRHLFLGTFNPSGGQKVNYYYGRDSNRTWEILSKISGVHFDPSNFYSFQKLLEKYGIACMDLIHSVKAPEERINRILGEGYKDTEIINKSTLRAYSTNSIVNVIKANPNAAIYSTWGKGSSFNEWKEEVCKLKNIVNLVSPSMAARVPKGQAKFEYMHADWKSKIKPIEPIV